MISEKDNNQKSIILSPVKESINISKSSNDLSQNFYPKLLSRKDTMYLSSLNSSDYPPKKFKQLATKRNWSLNLYNLDIQGSSPLKFGKFFKKVDFTNNNKDIEKSSSKPLFKKILPSFSLSTDGIHEAIPKKTKLKITRHTNPLQPVYNLPKSEEYNSNDNIDNIKNKFIKDTLNIDDIEGAKPKKFGNFFLRNTLNKDDIKETFVKKKYIRKEKYNSIDYSDINNIKYKRKVNLNPLNPIYDWNYSKNNIRYLIGPIEKNQPKPFSDIIYKKPFNLNNDDVEGTKTNTKNKFRIFKGSNSCLNISDIKGTNHGSLFKGIITKRNLNPLTPNYKYLGEEELNISNKISFNLGNKNNSNNLENKISNTISLNILKNDNINNNNNRKTPDIKKIKSDTDIENKINKSLANLNEIINNNDKPLFDQNKYKKPEIYFGLKHDKNINFINENNESNRINKTPNPNLRSFEKLIDSRINFANANKNNYNNNKNKNKSYEGKMDEFLDNLSLNLNKYRKRLKDNINAYYDIGFPDELKDNRKILNNIY